MPLSLALDWNSVATAAGLLFVLNQLCDFRKATTTLGLSFLSVK